MTYTVGRLLVADSFDRPDNPAIGSTDGGSLGPLSWQVDSGTNLGSWAISSNKCASVGGLSAASQVAWVDCGQSNVRVQLKISARPGWLANIGVVLRVVSRGSCYWWGDDMASGHKCYLQQKTTISDAGSSNVIAKTGRVYPGSTITIDAFGPDFVGWIDGVQVGEGSSAYNQTATKVGLWLNKDSIGAVDDFKVWKLNPVDAIPSGSLRLGAQIGRSTF